jgi:hypothetical protein
MATGLLSLCLATVIGIAGLATGRHEFLAPVPALVLGVFLASIVGFGQKIWPFMTWLHQSHRTDPRTVPHLVELWPTWVVRGTGWAVPTGIAGTAAGLFWRNTPLFQSGCRLLGAVVLGLALMVIRMLWVAHRRRYAVGSRLAPTP